MFPWIGGGRVRLSALRKVVEESCWVLESRSHQVSNFPVLIGQDLSLCVTFTNNRKPWEEPDEVKV